MVFFMISSQFFLLLRVHREVKRNWMKGMNFSWYIYVVVCIFMHVWLMMYCRWFFGAQIKRVAGFILSSSMIFTRHHDAIFLLCNFFHTWISSWFLSVWYYNSSSLAICRSRIPWAERHVSTNSSFSHINLIFHDETKISNWNLIQYFHISLMYFFILRQWKSTLM